MTKGVKVSNPGRRTFPPLIVAGALLALLISSMPGTALSAPGAPREALVDSRILEGAPYQSVLVHVAKSSTLRQGVAAARAAGLHSGTTYPPIKVFVGYGSRTELLRLSASRHVTALESNAPLELYTETSHIATRGQDVLDGAITGPRNSIFDGTGVGVAVVDSGIDGTHPDLRSRMGANLKVVCSTPQFVVTSLTGGFSECLGPKVFVSAEDTDTISGGGHGTHVAGIVAGTGSASDGQYHGAAPGATLYGISTGETLAVENALDGLAWVLANHDKVSPAIKVVNNSWGSGHQPYDPQNGPFHKATWKLQERLVAAGVTVVFAAGNSGGNGSTNTTSAECINPTPGIICVANYDDLDSGTRDGRIATTSSRGRTEQPQHWPDISAPGSRIISTCRLTLPVCNVHRSPVLDPPNLYAQLSGTSMAAPHVSGIVAQLYQAKPKKLTPAKVEDLLEDTAYKFEFGEPYTFDPFNPDDTSSFEKGHGLVDALAAVQALRGA